MSLFSNTLTLIIERTLPLTVGLFSIMLVQLVDSIFIGMLGLDALTVHGITLPFQSAIIGVQVGIGIAVTAIISKAYGAKDKVQSRSIASIGILFGTGFISLLCIALWLASTPILTIFIPAQTTAAQLDKLANLFNLYWPFWLLSAASSAALYLLTCVFRANQDTKTTGTMFLLASLINALLDPLFIFVFDMGIIGAAIASTLGFSYCAFYMLIKAKKMHWLSPFLNCFQKIEAIKELGRMSLATVLNQLLPAISAFLCVLLIARINTESIAFWNLLARLESFLLVFTLALTMSVPPMISRYLGEQNYQKLEQILFSSSRFLLCFHLVIALALILSSHWIIPLITQEDLIQHWLEIAIWILPASYAPLGLCMLVVSVFNALGAPKKALKVSVARLFFFYVPAIGLGALSNQMENVVWGACIANILAGSYAWFKLRKAFEIAEHKIQAIE